MDFIHKFNNWLAMHVVAIVSTMWCAYFFCGLAFFGTPQNGTPAQWVQWISQTFIQLTMLSILAVAQRLADEKQGVRHLDHKRMHEESMTAHGTSHSLHRQHADELRKLKQQHSDLQAHVKRMDMAVTTAYLKEKAPTVRKRVKDDTASVSDGNGLDGAGVSVVQGDTP